MNQPVFPKIEDKNKRNINFLKSSPFGIRNIYSIEFPLVRALLKWLFW